MLSPAALAATGRYRRTEACWLAMGAAFTSRALFDSATCRNVPTRHGGFQVWSHEEIQIYIELDEIWRAEQSDTDEVCGSEVESDV